MPAPTVPVTRSPAPADGLREALLGRVRPATIGQASRLPGVTPAALSLIQCFLEIQSRESRSQEIKSHDVQARRTA